VKIDLHVDFPLQAVVSLFVSVLLDVSDTLHGGARATQSEGLLESGGAAVTSEGRNAESGVRSQSHQPTLLRTQLELKTSGGAHRRQDKRGRLVAFGTGTPVEGEIRGNLTHTAGEERKKKEEEK
jgi:hypothetical protein